MLNEIFNVIIGGEGGTRRALFSDPLVSLKIAAPAGSRGYMADYSAGYFCRAVRSATPHVGTAVDTPSEPCSAPLVEAGRMLTVNERRESLDLSYGACRRPGVLVATTPAAKILGCLPQCCFSRARERAKNLGSGPPPPAAALAPVPPARPRHRPWYRRRLL